MDCKTRNQGAKNQLYLKLKEDQEIKVYQKKIKERNQENDTGFLEDMVTFLTNFLSKFLN